MSGLDIDTRSDIYSLGVLLYELLTGMTPFDAARLRDAGYEEMRRIIREEQPPKPSTRPGSLQSEPRPSKSGPSPSEPEAPARDSSAIACKTLAGASGSDSALPPPVPRPPLTVPSSSSSAITIARFRRTDPHSLANQLRGDLDWIVMKCLEKDRTRRYETANGVAADIQRFLSDEPVEARPPSATYKLRKFASRNKTGMVIAACFFLMFAVLIAGIGWVVRDGAARQAILKGQVTQALAESVDWQDRGKWPEALASVKRVESLLAASDVGAALHRQVQERRADLDLVAKLEEIRLSWQSVAPPDQGARGYGREALTMVFISHEDVDRAYAEAFREDGRDVDALGPTEAGAQIRTRSIYRELATALDHWALVRSKLENVSGSRHLLAVARAAEDDQ